MSTKHNIPVVQCACYLQIPYKKRNLPSGRSLVIANPLSETMFDCLGKNKSITTSKGSAPNRSYDTKLDQLSSSCRVARAAGQSSSEGWHQGSWRHQTMSGIANANTPGGNGSSKVAWGLKLKAIHALLRLRWHQELHDNFPPEDIHHAWNINNLGTAWQ